MRVKELKRILSKLPDDLLVVLQKDVEGNGYSPLNRIDGVNNVYAKESTWNGRVKFAKLTPKLIKQGFGNGDVGKGESCVVLVPVN